MTREMPKEHVHHIHPSGWENDPEEERFPLSLFDPIILVVYCQFALYFRTDEDPGTKEETASVLRQGLEKTLSQVRHLCGTIETDQGGGFSFVKKRGSTVKYVVKWLDAPGYPSLDDMEQASFSSRAMGDPGLWGLQEMPYGEGRSESNPYNSPPASGFQLNFVRGGAVFSSQVHHWAADLTGWSNFARQLADNCRAIHAAAAAAAAAVGPSAPPAGEIDFPPWDPACIDVSRFVKRLPAESLVDGPPVAPRHPDHPSEHQALLFHLPKSRAARLKALAAPEDGTSWVSTYDAACAFVWRQLTRVRASYYGDPDPAGPAPYFGQSVDMRPRFRNPAPTPPRMVRNMLAGGFSDATPWLPIPTIGEVLGVSSSSGQDVPLSRLASYVRQLTDSVTQARVEGVLEYIATLRDQQSISFNLMSKPPMSFFVTDHRTADVAGCDFGFGRPITHRFLTGESISPNMIVVYPPARTAGGSCDDDEGTVWSITIEKDLVPQLLENPEWCEYFEYRGVDSME